MIQPPTSPILIGHGYDLHKKVKGRKLILGGVEIDSDFGLLGHSDADCLTHALSDAILGALALPDIGYYFPNNEEKNKDINSLIILKKAVSEAKNLGYIVGNVDTTLILETPRILPYRDAIKKSLSDCIGVTQNRVGVKATTNEQIGAIGRDEGIAAFAVCTLYKNID